MKAVRVHNHGSVEALSYEDIPVPEPKENEILVKIEAAGVNFIDIYQRKGLYPIEVPYTLGKEGAGIVKKAWKNASDFKINDKVACASCIGSYAEYSIVPSWKLVKVPNETDIKIACAAMLQGMTAHYLTHSTFSIKKNNVILLHAAAGGVGLLLTQIAKKLGARVIGTVGNGEKAKLAKQNRVYYIVI